MNDRRIFTGLAVVVLLYLALRAVIVPITHDEARTFFVYVQTGAFMPYASHWDAGNHFLCTALAWVSYSLFGMAPWALRLFSVLAFMLYAWYVREAGLFVQHRLVRWCLWVTLLLLPWVIEFFALFRGYGLMLAFWMMALVHLVRFLQEERLRDLIWLLVALTLASYALLSMVLLQAGTLALVLIVIWGARSRLSLWRALLAWVLIGVVPLCDVAAIGSVLRERGLLYYGSTEGLYNGTLNTLCMNLFGRVEPLLVLVTGVIVIAMIAPLVLIVKRGWTSARDPLVVIAALLVFDLIGRKAMALVLGTLYPMDRTVMHYVPLGVLLIALAVDRSAIGWPHARFAAFVLLVLPLQTMRTANLTHTMQWRDEAVSLNVLERAVERQQAADRPLMLCGYAQMPAVWDYAGTYHHLDLPSMSPLGFPQPVCDLLLIDTAYFTTPPGFRTIAVSATGEQVLKERIEPLSLRQVFDTTLHNAKSNNESTMFWEPLPGRVLGKELAFEFDLDLHIDKHPTTAILVIEGDDDQGGHAFYDMVELRSNLSDADKGVLHIMRRVPRIDEHLKRLAIYLYNPERDTLTIERLRLTTFEITNAP